MTTLISIYDEMKKRFERWEQTLQRAQDAEAAKKVAEEMAFYRRSAIGLSGFLDLLKSVDAETRRIEARIGKI